jgi:hypothetical protein
MRPKRKAIPQWVKNEVIDRQEGRCAECGLELADKTEFDHRPPLILREIIADAYFPPQNHPDFIDAVHKPCHLKRTVGRTSGASKTVTTKGSDAYLAAKFRKLERNKPAKKSSKLANRATRWPKRAFPKRTKR